LGAAITGITGTTLDLGMAEVVVGLEVVVMVLLVVLVTASEVVDTGEVVTSASASLGAEVVDSVDSVEVDMEVVEEVLVEVNEDMILDSSDDQLKNFSSSASISLSDKCSQESRDSTDSALATVVAATVAATVIAASVVVMVEVEVTSGTGVVEVDSLPFTPFLSMSFLYSKGVVEATDLVVLVPVTGASVTGALGVELGAEVEALSEEDSHTMVEVEGR